MDDKLNGIYTRYYTNGNIKTISTYVNDELHGEQFLYYDNGFLNVRLNYVNNLMVGEQSIYDKDNDSVLIEKYNTVLFNDKIVIHGIYENFNKSFYSTLNFVNGILVGLQKFDIIVDSNTRFYIECNTNKLGQLHGLCVVNINNKTRFKVNYDSNSKVDNQYINTITNLLYSYNNYTNNILNGESGVADINGKVLKVMYDNGLINKSGLVTS